MHVPEFIQAKRDGRAHDPAALRAFVSGVADGSVPDYQAAAWLMAVCFTSMTDEETAVFAEAMADSGDRLDLADLPRTVDKHSTGGVGDKTTLVLAPLMAALGGTVAKVSGRGLGHTGGTIDKLEAIPGYRATLSREAFLAQAHEVGVVVTGQSARMAPADGTLYALRDATATVMSLPLIAASVMCKKLAGGAQAIQLDVKTGRGAFMATSDEARALGRRMRAIGERAGRAVGVTLSSMDQPLGRTVGNALEVREAIDALRGGGPADLRALTIALATDLAASAGLQADAAEVAAALDDGRAFAAFERWIQAQGGDLAHRDALALAPGVQVVTADRDGVVATLDALAFGRAVRQLGGGRAAKGDDIDLGVGTELHAKIGDPVTKGEPLLTIRHRAGRGLEVAQELLRQAVSVADRAEPPPLLLGSA